MIQQRGHPPPNVPRPQNLPQMGAMNIPPAVQMNQRGFPRVNLNGRAPGGVPQPPGHHVNRNIHDRQHIHQGPLQGQNQAPRQVPIINRAPPQMPAFAVRGYGPAPVPRIHVPRIQHIHPYAQVPRRGDGYNPNMTLDEALNSGFNGEAIGQPTRMDQNGTGMENNQAPRNTGYVADTRIRWSQNNLVPDIATRRRE